MGLFRKSSAKNLSLSPDDTYKMGLNYYHGIVGVSQNYGEAVLWWTKAAEQGNADSHENIELCQKEINRE